MPTTPERDKQNRLKDRQEVRPTTNVGSDRAANVFVPNPRETYPRAAINLSGLAPSLQSFIADYNEAEDIEEALAAKARINEALTGTTWPDLMDQGVPYDLNPKAREVTDTALARRGADTLADQLAEEFNGLVRRAQSGDYNVGDPTVEADNLIRLRRQEFEEAASQGENPLLNRSIFQKAKWGEILNGNEQGAGVLSQLRQNAISALSKARAAQGEAAFEGQVARAGVQAVDSTIADTNASPDALRIEDSVIEQLQVTIDASDSFGFRAGGAIVTRGLLRSLSTIRARDKDGSIDDLALADMIQDASERLTVREPGTHERVSVLESQAGEPLRQEIEKLRNTSMMGKNTGRRQKIFDARIDNSVTGTMGERLDAVRTYLKDPSAVDLEGLLLATPHGFAEGSDEEAAFISKALEEANSEISRRQNIETAGDAQRHQDYVNKLMLADSPTEVQTLLASMSGQPRVNLPELYRIANERTKLFTMGADLPAAKAVESDLNRLFAAVPSGDGTSKDALVGLRTQAITEVRAALAKIAAESQSEAEQAQRVAEYVQSEDYRAIVQRSADETASRNGILALKAQVTKDATNGIFRPEDVKKIEESGMVPDTWASQVEETAKQTADPETYRSNRLRGMATSTYDFLIGAMSSEGEGPINGLLVRDIDPVTMEPIQPQYQTAEGLKFQARLMMDDSLQRHTAAALEAKVPRRDRDGWIEDRVLRDIKVWLNIQAGAEFEVGEATEAQEREFEERVRQAAIKYDGRNRTSNLKDSETAVKARRASARMAAEEEWANNEADPWDEDEVSRAYGDVDRLLPGWDKFTEILENNRYSRTMSPIPGMGLLPNVADFKDLSRGGPPEGANYGPIRDPLTGDLIPDFGNRETWGMALRTSGATNIWGLFGGTASDPNYVLGTMQAYHSGYLSNDSTLYSTEKPASRYALAAYLHHRMEQDPAIAQDPNNAQVLGVLKANGVPFLGWLWKEEVSSLGLAGEFGARTAQAVTEQHTADIRAMDEYAANHGAKWDAKARRYESSDSKVQETLNQMAAIAESDRRRGWLLSEGRGIPTEKLNIDPLQTRMFKDPAHVRTFKADPEMRKAVAARIGVPVDSELERNFWLLQERMAMKEPMSRKKK